MPNYCSNTVTLTHKDKNELVRAARAFRDNRLFRELVPLKDGESATAIWGTKWDVGEKDGCVIDECDDLLKLSFDTAWAPPIEFYDAIMELGFTVDANYHEPGMAFCGYYFDGSDIQYDYDIDDLSNIPVHVIADFDLDYDVEEAEEEEAE